MHTPSISLLTAALLPLAVLSIVFLITLPNYMTASLEIGNSSFLKQQFWKK